jgi:hypothetical protein
MIDEPGIFHKLYKKLLTLYPRAFKEQLGESMEQTFNDLCRERYEAGGGLIGFVLLTFVDTLAGIIKENIKKENVIMVPILRNFGVVIISVIAAIAILVSTYLTKNLDSMWIILLIWSITWPLWEWWIKDKR